MAKTKRAAPPILPRPLGVERFEVMPLDEVVSALGVPHHERAALWTLVAAGPEAVGAVKAGLQSPNATTRRGCCEYLDLYGDEEAAQAMIPLLEDLTIGFAGWQPTPSPAKDARRRTPGSNDNSSSVGSADRSVASSAELLRRQWAASCEHLLLRSIETEHIVVGRLPQMAEKGTYPNAAMELIYHLAVGAEWTEAIESGRSYARSTLGKSLADEGFIHCSFASQVGTIADLVYKGRSDVMLLVIDPSQLPAEIRVENTEGWDDLFPHVYGELPLSAVIRAESVGPRGDGTFELSGLL